MSYDIFNPKVCFVNELKSSWAKSIKTSENPNKLPISIRGAETFLDLSHNGDGSWCAGVIALCRDWSEMDVGDFVNLNFSFYTEEDYSMKVSLVDKDEGESNIIDVNRMGFSKGDYNEVMVPLKKLSRGNSVFDARQARLLKFVLGEGSSVLVSRVFLD